MIQELIYTSAPRGLKPGSRGFCTVASTQGMALNLAERLESLSGYRHLFPPQDNQSPLNPIVWSHLRITLGGYGYHVLSRISPAGLDYTKRSNKFAHHLVLDGIDLHAAGPAAMLASPGFMEMSWDGTPKLLSAGRARPQIGIPPGGCPSWKDLAGDAGWAGVLGETAWSAATPYRATVIYSPGTNVLPLFVEALNLLPSERRWQVTFSTYYTQLPPGVDCQWRALVDGSPEAANARRNRDSLLLDLCSPLGHAGNSVLVEAARAGKVAIAVPMDSPSVVHTGVESSIVSACDHVLDDPPQRIIEAGPRRPHKLVSSAPQRSQSAEQQVYEVPFQPKKGPRWPIYISIASVLLLTIGFSIIAAYRYDLSRHFASAVGRSAGAHQADVKKAEEKSDHTVETSNKHRTPALDKSQVVHLVSEGKWEDVARMRNKLTPPDSVEFDRLAEDEFVKRLPDLQSSDDKAKSELHAMSKFFTDALQWKSVQELIEQQYHTTFAQAKGHLVKTIEARDYRGAANLVKTSAENLPLYGADKKSDITRGLTKAFNEQATRMIRSRLTDPAEAQKEYADIVNAFPTLDENKTLSQEIAVAKSRHQLERTFASLPKAKTLPAPTAPRWVDAEFADAPLELRIVSPDAESGFRIKHVTSGRRGVWELHHEGNNLLRTFTLGTFQITRNGIEFSRQGSTQTVLQDPGLVNCIVVLACGDLLHPIALREPAVADPLKCSLGPNNSLEHEVLQLLPMMQPQIQVAKAKELKTKVSTWTNGETTLFLDDGRNSVQFNLTCRQTATGKAIRVGLKYKGTVVNWHSGHVGGLEGVNSNSAPSPVTPKVVRMYLERLNAARVGVTAKLKDVQAAQAKVKDDQRKQKLADEEAYLKEKLVAYDGEITNANNLISLLASVDGMPIEYCVNVSVDGHRLRVSQTPRWKD